MEYKPEFIESSKIAVDELLKVIRADINMEDITKNSKGKAALKTKKKAIVECKQIIAGILQHDYHQQVWARKKITQIVEFGDSAIESLLSGLKDPININTTGISDDAEDISNAIDSKSIAFDDAVEIMDVITDLKRISEEDEIVMNGSDFSGGYAEQYADKFEKLPDKSGYDAKNDYIIIDPDGSVGEIVEIEGIKIALPEKPARKDIYGYEKNKKEQYWVRQKPPKSLTPKTAKSYSDFIENEYQKKRKGFWFYNNGTPEYITGAHWFLLNYCRTEAEGGYYFFSKAQQKLFWFAEACWCDDRCYGMIVEKIRRFGMTYCMLAFSLCKGTSARDKNCGMTSKTDEDAGKNFLKLTWMFCNLPFFFKPVCLNEKSKSKLEFSSPAQRLTKNNKDKETVDDALNTVIDFLPTKIDSYDGTAQYVYIADEFSKWKKQNGDTLTHWGIVKKCLTKGKRITGKAFIVSTIENITGKDPDDPDALAGDKYKYLYYNSDPTQRDANGRTLTGLYKLFISCLEHYEGFIDIYGNCIAKDPEKPVIGIDGDYISIGVETFIRNELNAIQGNTRAIFEYKRKTPIKEGDGFIISDGTCAFNQANIQAQILYNDNLKIQPYRVGNFAWKDGIPDCKQVIWKDTPEGRFKITWLPEKDLQNNVRIFKGELRPMNDDIGSFGIDPYRVGQTVTGKGSKGSMHGYAIHNAKGAPNDSFFLEYINRPASKDIFYEDMIMAMVFYGMPALIENNVNNLIEEMYRRGYRKFSKLRPDKPFNKLSEDEKKYGGIPSSSENTLQMMSSALESYIEYHVGNEGKMYFNQTLQDWLVFDQSKRTKRDASISSSLAIIGATSKIKRMIVPDHENGSRTNLLLMTYDNTGTTSKIIK